MWDDDVWLYAGDSSLKGTMETERDGQLELCIH